jgi:hypothetical protein
LKKFKRAYLLLQGKFIKIFKETEKDFKISKTKAKIILDNFI